MAGPRSAKTRRQFLKGTVATGAGVTLGLSAVAGPVAGRALGANERVRIGCIGVGNRGTRLIQRLVRIDDVEFVALCDVYRPYLERDRSKVSTRLLEQLGGRVPGMTEPLPKSLGRYRDFRRLLDRKDIDAVFIATPDHWHALQAIAACEAEKDVYVEKPLSLTIVEGRKMVAAAERTGRIVQVGLQRRSSTIYRKLAAEVKAGLIGKVSTARAYRISNMCPKGIGKASPSAPPEGLDWELWLGPRPWRPYQDNLALYRFRWWKEYSSQVANWGVHYFDAIRWVLGEEAPSSVSAHGGRYAIDDDRTIPDTMEVVFEFSSGRLVVFGQYEASGGKALEDGEIELRGSKANVYVSDRGYEVVPSSAGQFQDRAPRLKAATVEGDGQDTAEDHIRNFIDCVRSRKRCHCDMETGHRSTTFALLANLALETRSRLEWDPVSERITNNESANALLHYEYRSPWKL